MTPAILLLAFVTAERLAELVLARRNTRALLAQGAVEYAPGHYPLIVALHALWLAGLWVFGASQPVSVFWFGIFVLLQAARLWVLATLGPRWTTRIIVLPGAPLVAKGPYRFVSHPNYLVVIGEIAVLPLCFGLTWFAVVFSLANAAVLAIRIRAESTALAAAPP
jgi:methyltransferase